MRELKYLMKISIINTFNLQGMDVKAIFNDRKKIVKYIAYLALMSFFVVVYIGYIKIIGSYTDGFRALNQDNMVNAMIYNMMSVLIFIMGIPYVMAYFYFSRDTEMLLALPIKPRNIVLSKFMMLVLLEYIVVFLMMIPALVLGGITLQAGISYYLVGVIVMLLTPIAPLALCSTIIILISRVTNLASKKNLLRGIFLFLITIGAIGFQIFIQKYALESGGSDFMMTLITDNKSLLGLLGKINPLAQWVGNSLTIEVTLSSLTQLFYFIITSLGLYLVFMLVGEKVYLGSIVGGHEVVSKKKRLSDQDLYREISRGNRPYMAIFKTDMITMIKTPIYLFNCLAVVVIIPLLLMIPLVTGVNLNGLDMTVIVTLFKNNEVIANFVIAGVIMLVGAITPIASTTFSREGKYFWISRIIPVSPRDHIIGRGLSALLAQVFLAFMLTIILYTSIPISVMTYGCILLGVLGSIPIALAGMLIDAEKPLLNWTNPQRAVKQNMNAIFAMLAGGLITALLGGLTYMLMQLAISGVVIMLVDLIIIVMVTIVLYQLLYRRIRLRFVEINA